MGEKKKYVSVRLEESASKKLKETVVSVQGFGFKNLPPRLACHFAEGVTNSAIINAALDHLEETCLNDREPSAE